MCIYNRLYDLKKSVQLIVTYPILSRFPKRAVSTYPMQVVISTDKALRGLDIDKLMFIRQVLDRNLIVDYQLNETKLEILKKLDALPTLPMKEMEVPHLDKWFTDIFDKARDRTRTEVDSRNVDEIKKLVFYAFTEEGLKKTLSSYTKDEFMTALRELGEGI